MRDSWKKKENLQFVMVTETLFILTRLSARCCDSVYHYVPIIIHPPLMRTLTLYKICMLINKEPLSSESNKETLILT